MTAIRYLVLVGLTLIPSCRPSDSTFEGAKALFLSNQLDKALVQFQDLSDRDTVDALTLAYLADTYRRTGSPGRAVETARRALALDACLSFAHCVIAEATIPLAKNWEGTNADTAWVHLRDAATCDTTDGHPWLIIWGESIRRGELDRASLAAR